MSFTDYINVLKCKLGLSMELVIMDVPEGKHVTRITKTKKFPFPEAMDSFSVDFLSLLELAWKGREMMIENLAVLYGKKRKVAQLMTDEDDVVVLSPSFIRKNY